MNAPEKSEKLAPIQPLLDDPTISEIMVDGYERVYVEQHGKFEDVPTPFRDDEQVLEVIKTIAHQYGREVNESAPLMDLRLFDGSRVNVVVPPISLVGPVLTIRKFETNPLTIEALLGFGSWTEDMVTFLRACVQSRLNMIIAGGTGSGKTTILNLVAGMISNEERIITVENAAEMQLPQKRVVTLESRPANIEGQGEVSIRDLVSNALRMRPDRIILGEARGAEILDLLQAMNTGHDGSMASIHSNGIRDTVARMEMMASQSEFSIPLLTVRETIASAVDIIVYQARLQDGSRKMINITEVTGMQGDVIVLQDIFKFEQGVMGADGKVTGKSSATGIIPKVLSRIQAAGIELPLSLFTPIQSR